MPPTACLFNYQYLTSWQISRIIENVIYVSSSVGSEPKLGSGSSFWAKKLGSACHAFQKARLGLPYLAKKAWFSSVCSMILKTELHKKLKMS